MKALEAKFLKFLKDIEHLIIPVYQRPYSWTKEQCERLWKDIERVSSDKESHAHFIGSIVYIEKGIYHNSSVQQVLVIDGQQRLTSISLLIAAFADLMDSGQKECTAITAKKIRNHYLVNIEEADETFYKLALTVKDRKIYNDIIDQKKIDTHHHSHVLDNYQFFYEKIRKSSLSLDAIYDGLQKLIVVDIALDRERDNPQLIFESLNSTGLDLSQADLIRNYFLMGLDQKDQTRLYNDYWFKLESNFDLLGAGSYFDRFIRDYLTLKTGSIPKIGYVYEEFKNFVQREGPDKIEDIIKDVYKNGTYYFNLSYKEEDMKLEKAFRDLRELRVDVTYPFLLQVYADFKTGIIEKNQFIEIIELIESYVFRRAICGIPTNSLNNTFAALMKAIDKSEYLPSLKATFQQMSSYRRFPTDEEFVSELKVKDVYNLRIRNYLLRKLENYNRKEEVQVANYTIEHILPQNENLSVSWQNQLGDGWKEIQEKYLHRLGNLTLTGYNSELSDRPFTEKLGMTGGFKTSPLWLNQSVAKHENWSIVEIEERAEELADRAMRIWTFPTLSEKERESYSIDKTTTEQDTKYSMEYHQESFSAETLSLFQKLQTRILNIDSSVKEEFKKNYIVYKTGNRNFLAVIPHKKDLSLLLYIKLYELNDDKQLCRDVSEIGRWSNGDVEVRLSNQEDVDYILHLIEQSFELNAEGV